MSDSAGAIQTLPIRSAALPIPIVLNIGEGNERIGKERAYHFRVAAGSAGEVRAGLRLAVAWGDLLPMDVQPILDTVSSVIRILSKLAGRR